MANEFKVKNGLIVIGDLTTSGTITINGALAATQSWVTSQAYLTSASLSGYATQSYVTSAIAALVDSAPAALDTLNELAAALGDDANFSTTITNSIASKQSQLNGTGLVRMSGTSVSYDNTTYLVSNFGNIEGDHTYGYPSSEGWYKIAEVVLTSTCQSFNLWGEYRDTGYFDNSHYRIHITARAECDFPTNNENHAINVNIYGSSTNDTYFSNNVRVVLTQSSSNYRKYELQYYRSTWDTGSWRLQTLGWTTYTTSQTAGTPTGTPRVYYVSKFSTDNIFVSNRISIGTTYAGFAANIAGTTYIIGASAWVNDGYGITNASSPGTGFFPYSDGNSVINSNNTTRLFVNGSTGNIGIGTSSPASKLQVAGDIRIQNETGLITDYGPLIGRYNTSQVYVGTGGSYSIVKIGRDDGGALNVLSGGNVGIGTTSPIYKLQVAGSAYVNGGTLFLDSDQYLRWGNSNQGIVGSNDNHVSIVSGGATRQSIYADGRTYFPGLDLSISNVNSTHGTANYFRGDTSHFVLGTGGTLYLNYANTSGSTFIYGTTYVNGNIVWHAGNDGTGSGLDADTVDGVQADSIVYGNARGTNQSITNNNNDLDKTGYYTADAFTTRPSGVANWMYIEHIKLYNDNTAYQKQLGYDTYDDRMWVRTKSGGAWSSWKQIWTSDSLTNLNQLTNGPGYITGYSETDTLASVTGTSDGLFLASATGRGIYFRVNGGANDDVTINASGNVGIGTTSPSQKLSVSGNISLDTGGYIYGDSGNPYLNLSQTNGTLLAYGSSSQLYLAGSVTTLSAGSNYLALITNGSERIRITSAGNVGIGTTTPQKKLDVFGSAGIVTSIGSNIGPGQFAGLHFGYSESYVNNDSYKKSALVFERTDNHGQGGNASGKIHFLLNNITSTSANALTDSVVTIDSDASATVGSVRMGIGTRNPSRTLDVNGEIGLAGRLIGYGKNALQMDDSWLRLNQEGHFGSGVYTPGVMRADGGFQVSGNTVIHSGTIGSQSVSYANSAGSAGQVTNQSGQLLRFDNRVISPSETTAGYLQFGFTSWANDNSAPYADYLHMRSYTDGSGGTDNLVMFKKSGIGMRIYQQTFASTTPYADYVDVWTTANFTSTNVSNWNTAYGWGNHASAGYATTSYVTTQINNLIAGAPGALDTLDELAAALGDDSNFATTVTNSIAAKLPLAGGTMTGDINWTQTDRGLTWNMNTDGAYIKFYNTGDGDANSRLEYATSDNGDEYHRWVIGGTEKMTLKSAGLTINGTITATGYNNTNWDTAYSSLANYLLLAGGTMSGSINMNGNNVTNIGQVNATHAILTNDGSSRVMYIRGSGNIIQFQDAAANNKWEIVGRDGEFYVYKSDGAGSGYKWRIDGVGNHTITGNLTVTGTITESSSLKLKENVETSEGNLEKVVNLRPVTYNKIGSETKELGLIAEEVAEVYPEFVQYDENGDPIGVNYSRLTAALIGAVKELTNQVQELNKKING